jgi:hypothetical protein
MKHNDVKEKKLIATHEHLASFNRKKAYPHCMPILVNQKSKKNEPNTAITVLIF